MLVYQRVCLLWIATQLGTGTWMYIPVSKVVCNLHMIVFATWSMYQHLRTGMCPKYMSMEKNTMSRGATQINSGKCGLFENGYTLKMKSFCEGELMINYCINYIGVPPKL